MRLRSTTALFYGLSAERIAAVSGVSRRTALAYLDGRSRPSVAVLRLLTLYREERVLEGAFLRFRTRDGKLIDPVGYVFTAAILEGYQSMLEWAHGMAHELGRASEYQRRLKVLEVAVRDASSR